MIRSPDVGLQQAAVAWRGTTLLSDLGRAPQHSLLQVSVKESGTLVPDGGHQGKRNIAA
jgi:hypothetical protein